MDDIRPMRRAVFAVFFTFAIGTAARADEVTTWNEVLFRSAIVAGTSSLNMTRFTALVQVAVFDAVNGIEGRYTPIHVAPAGPAGASSSAAAMQAAYSILSRLYGQGGLFTPSQQPTLDADLTASLARIASHDSAAAIASGRAWGQTVADAVWTWRSTDGFDLAPATWVGFTTLGQWRPTPSDPYPSPAVLPKGNGYPQYVMMTPWSIPSPSQFRPGGPPSLTSAQYARDFNETMVMGRQTSTARSSEQTVYSWFWATGSTSYVWNNVALSLLEGRGENADDQNDSGGTSTLLRNARVLATLDIAIADAAIGCWDAKYAYNFWRPITAIRETADDGNPATTPDPTWTPLITAPAHPEYPSAHSCVSGAATMVLAHEFGEHGHFDITTDLLLGVTRSYQSFTDALEEVKNARVFAGIHFRTSCDDGAMLGKQVAQYVLDHNFQRVR
jgi:PAP2 superfamily